jgi:methyl-accepting chemotaxis protein
MINEAAAELKDLAVSLNDKMNYFSIESTVTE